MGQDRRVVFVCEHGSAKSVVAAAHFNRLARERGVGLRAVSRGTSPDAEVAPSAALGLEADGLDVAGVPERLSTADVETAARIVAFGPLPGDYCVSEAVELWDDVPPVSEDYGRARGRILERLTRLIEDLEAAARAAGGPRE